MDIRLHMRMEVNHARLPHQFEGPVPMRRIEIGLDLRLLSGADRRPLKTAIEMTHEVLIPINQVLAAFALPVLHGLQHDTVFVVPFHVEVRGASRMNPMQGTLAGAPYQDLVAAIGW